MGGERPFLQDHALQLAPVIFEQLGRPEVAGDQDRVLRQAGLRRGAELAGDDAEQPVRQIVEVVHPVLQQRIVDLAHPRLHALADALDRRLGGEAAVDRLVDPPRPALVIGEHLVGLEHLLMLADRAELGMARHRVDLLAHPREGGIDAVALGLGVFGDGMLDQHPRLVVDGMALGHPDDQLQSGQPGHAGFPAAVAGHRRAVGEPGIGDQLGQDHRHRLQRLDLDLVIGARIGMLDGEHADRPFLAHDRHAGEAVEQLLSRLGAVGEFGMARRLGEVQHRHLAGDGADQALAHGELGDVDRALVEAQRGEQLEHAVAQQVDRADLAGHRLGDDPDDLVELCLGAGLRGHHVMETGQDLAGGRWWRPSA